MNENSPRILSSENSILLEFMRDLRDIDIQQDRLRFRRNIERVGEILAYEISRHLLFKDTEVRSSLGIKQTRTLKDYPVICSVLRAGLPFQNGFLHFFDRSDAAFISAYRKSISETDFEILVEYMASPELQGKTLILTDPMLATGRSLHLTYEALLKNGKPERVIIAALIASKAGIAFIRENIPDAELFIADADNELNDHSYIVPGLGDAGDLAFGQKC
jgi:uracil phosphoribosyltransferase